MKRFACLFAVLVVGPAVSALAQVPLPPPADLSQPAVTASPSTVAPQPLLPQPSEHTTHMSLGELTPTPQMWFYEQDRKQYDDPKAAVRANAEFRAGQRMRRLAAQQWYGYSNARPMAAATPTHTTYSPQWGGNVADDPYLWTGASRPTVVLLPDRNGGYGLR